MRQQPRQARKARTSNIFHVMTNQYTAQKLSQISIKIHVQNRRPELTQKAKKYSKACSLFFDQGWQLWIKFQQLYNNSLTMKQRKKIKYVQKQPPDKANQKVSDNTANAQKPNPNNSQGANTANKSAKVETTHQQQSAYLISEGKVEYEAKPYREKPHKKEEYKPKYVAKEEALDAKYDVEAENNTKRAPNNRNSYQKRLQAPSYQERESSHHDHICVICTEQIRRKDWIWTCVCCCISMHLKCIKQWIQNINQQLDKKAHIIFNWKCPQCNFEYNEPLPKYYCYCGKHLNPELDRDLQAHSCGQICGKKRGAYCPHPCTDVCHSGKCKPCDYEGTIVTCQCGKSQRSVKCSEERQVFQCGKKCEKILNCHNHKCERNCHAGDCVPCKKKHMVSCFCGKADDIIDCSLPSYSCNEICGKPLNCGYHNCEEKCHAGNCGKCQKTPQLQKTCPCGKYDIQMLTGDPEYRKSCAESIPVCGMPCSKKLQCGHSCPRSCHEGTCPQCKVTTEQTCICGLQSRKIECWRKNKQPFRCQFVCKKKRSCGQHICNQVCCRFRNSPYVQNHPCELTCNKMLNCQKHECGEACHIGLCKKCPVIYSQPQPCPCGKTFLKPPIVCGTLVPQCNNVCEKQLPCGHKCKNSCHYGPCKCHQSVVVPCRCGKQNIPTTCGREALCLNKCPKILQCGHKCDLQCHKDTCEVAHKASPCRKMCNKERKDCHHFCPQLCHPGQLCESFPCQAQILVKCDCGHRQTMSLCGAHDHHKTKKAIICNKKCENLKRFDILYKNKEIYYPGNMVQLAFKNFVYLQNLQSRLQKFILHSDQSFIEIEYKFPDHNTKLLLTDLFENFYHLNTHFYRYGKYSAFTLMQSEHTMVPKPVLTQYAKLIAKGTIKQSNLPFQYTISFECDQRERSALIIKSLKDYMHKYYSERNNKFVSLHFWSKEDGEDALRFLENQYQTMEFRCSLNITKVEEEIKQNQIIESEVQEAEEEPAKFNKKQALKQKAEESQEKLASLSKQQKQGNVQPQKEQKPSEQKPVFEGPKRIPSTAQQGASKIIVRKGIPNFKKNDYPDAKENIQDIYLIDQDELYNEKVNWQNYVNTLCSKKMGPQATEWKIRTLLMISSFHPIQDHVLHEQFEKIIAMYNKDKEAAMRILELQRIDNKSVKKQMNESGIYLSDHQPEILSYLQIYNYLSDEKIALELPEIIQKTPQVIKVHEILQAIESKDAESFCHHFNSADYILSCALIPIVHEFREIILQDIKNGVRVAAKNLFKHLLFDSEAEFLQYALKNGLVVESRLSKTSKEDIYYLKSGSLVPNLAKNDQFLKKIFQKRHKKYFLTEPEELVQEEYMTRSFFAFGDYKESVSPKYMGALVKLLKQRE